MKKRGISGLIAAVAAGLIIAGCGGGSGSGTGAAAADTGTQSEAAEDAGSGSGTGAGETGSGTGTGADMGSDGSALDGEAAGEPEETETLAEEISFEELTVVDNDECSLVIKSLNPDGFWGYTLDVELENKSAEKNYMFSVVSSSVNGVEASAIFASKVAPGKKSIDDLSFTDSTLKENGIDRFTDIEITFRVYDSDDWLADEAARETVHIYPYGEENAVRFEREALDSDIVLADNDYVTVTVTGIAVDDIWGYGPEVYLVNKTDTETMFSLSDSSVNGYMSDPFWAKSVSPGKCAFSKINWSKSSLEELGITDPENEIEALEFTLKAYNTENYREDPYFEEVIVLEP